MKWYVLGYPRSGNSWVRYILRACAGLPPCHAHAQSDDFSKIHWWDHDKCDDRGLILVVRNYKEAIIRHNLINHESTPGPNQWSWKFIFHQSWAPYKTIEPVVSYMHPLLVFLEQWKNRPKKVVYYEDLIQFPEISIRNLCNSISLPYQDFLDNYEQHRETCMKDYGESKTDGKTVIYYRDLVPVETRYEWDEWLKQYKKRVFMEFLERYYEVHRS